MKHMKLPNGCMDSEISPVPTFTEGWVVNWCENNPWLNFSFSLLSSINVGWVCCGGAWRKLLGLRAFASLGVFCWCDITLFPVMWVIPAQETLAITELSLYLSIPVTARHCRSLIMAFQSQVFLLSHLHWCVYWPPHSVMEVVSTPPPLSSALCSSHPTPSFLLVEPHIYSGYINSRVFQESWSLCSAK